MASTDTPQPPFPSYRGSEPYAFVCYSHADAPVVYPFITWLKDQGVRLWYDEGISPGQRWRDELADAINGCALFITLLSPSAIASANCRKEINYADENNKPALTIYLSETRLPSGLALALGDVQAIEKHQLTETAFHAKTLTAIRNLLGAVGEAPVYTPAIPNLADRPRNSWVGLTVIVTLLALTGAVAYLFIKHELTSSGLRTIAVLPFDNFTSDPANDYLSNGIAEEIINLLEKVQSLNVVGRTASFYYKDKGLDFTTIARRLRADIVLEGSLRRVDNRLRVAAQLVNGETGLHEWSDMFEQDLSDSITVQQEIALSVAKEMSARLSPAETADIKQPLSDDPVTVALYLEARNYLRIASTAADLQTAESLFGQAIERDATFEEAISGLCETKLAQFERSRSSADYGPASAVCARLTGGDHQSVEAQVALGTLNRKVGNYAEALALFDAAITARPKHEPAYYGRARALEGLGRLSEAEVSLQQGIRLQPGYWQTYASYGTFLAMSGRLPEAVDQFRTVVRLTPENPQGFANLGTALFAKGDWEKAERAWANSLSLEATPNGYTNLATAHYYRGDFSGAIETLQEGIEIFPDTYDLYGKLGAAYAAVSNTDDANTAFERAVALAKPLLELDTADGWLLSHLCVYQTRLKHAELGLPLCEQAVVNAPKDPEVRYLYATALRLAGEIDAANTVAQEALGLGYSEYSLANDPVFKVASP